MVGICWLSNALRARPQKPILYVLPIENILGKLPVVPARDTGTIPFLLKRDIEGSGAFTDREKGAGDSCQMWYVILWALGWSRDM